MPISIIVLLTGKREAPTLTEMLRRSNPGLIVRPVFNVDDLILACASDLTEARLLSFCSGVIVPAALLDRFPGPSYNFHPGPPERPGNYPALFALYERAERFGITVHEMVAAVDAGPIVVADWFEVPPDYDFDALESLTLFHLAKVFFRLSPHLAKISRPLLHSPFYWHGRKSTKAECKALCTITPSMDPVEAAHRRRCCGTLIST